MKRIVILGSTGSIGTNTLDIISKFPEKFQAVGLTAGNNVDKLEEQVRTFSPAVVAMADPAAAERLRTRCKSLKTTILNGTDGLMQAATLPEADLVISAIVGGAGLVPTLAAIKAGKFIALANKEPMVMAGRLMQEEARKRGVRIFPVDSEHSALFQSMEGHRVKDVRRPAVEPDQGATARRHGRAGPPASELEDGRQDHHRLGDPDEQGPGSRGSPVAVRHPRLEDRSGGPPREHHPLARRVRGPLGDRPTRPSGHADPDRLRDELPGARPAGSPFSEPGPDRHAHVLQSRS